MFGVARGDRVLRVVSMENGHACNVFLECKLCISRLGVSWNTSGVLWHFFLRASGSEIWLATCPSVNCGGVAHSGWLVHVATAIGCERRGVRRTLAHGVVGDGGGLFFQTLGCA